MHRRQGKRGALVLSVFLLGACVSLFEATPMDPKEAQVQRIVETGKTKEDAYIRALTWFADTFKSADAVIQVDDKETGLLVGKAWFPPPSGQTLGSPQIWFTVKVETKDERSSIQFYDLYLEVTVSGRTDISYFTTEEFWNRYKGEFLRFADEFENYMIAVADEW